MTKTFRRSGVTVQYPTNWTLAVEDEDAADAWAAVIESPGTAFLTLSLRPLAGDAAAVAAEAVAALTAEYPAAETEPVAATVAGRPAVGADVDFLTLDTAVSVRVRAVDTAAGPLLILAQVGDFDAHLNGDVLSAMIESVAIDDD